MIIKVYANDGREFKGYNYEVLVKACKDYESELALKKQKEEEAQKQVPIALARVKDAVDELNNSIEQYRQVSNNLITLLHDGEKIIKVVTSKKISNDECNIGKELYEAYEKLFKSCSK